MNIYFFNFNKIFLLFLFLWITFINYTNAKETYFDLSEDNIKIETDFDGKEIIIFGILKDGLETIITIKGPLINSKIQKKENIFGFWFNTKQITYNSIPSIFFISSSSAVKDILPISTLIKEGLSFEHLLENKIYNRNFSSDANQKQWKENFIRIKKEKGLFKNFDLKKVKDKLFQTRVFFPSNSMPGIYNVIAYEIKDQVIITKDIKSITIKKFGIGSQIYNFANNHPAAYGFFAIIFAIISGVIAATLFRRAK